MSPTLQTKYPRLLENVKENQMAGLAGGGRGFMRYEPLLFPAQSSSTAGHTSFRYKEVYASGVHEGMVHNVKHKVQMIEV